MVVVENMGVTHVLKAYNALMQTYMHAHSTRERCVIQFNYSTTKNIEHRKYSNQMMHTKVTNAMG